MRRERRHVGAGRECPWRRSQGAGRRTTMEMPHRRSAGTLAPASCCARSRPHPIGGLFRADGADLNRRYRNAPLPHPVRRRPTGVERALAPAGKRHVQLCTQISERQVRRAPGGDQTTQGLYPDNRRLRPAGRMVLHHLGESWRRVGSATDQPTRRHHARSPGEPAGPPRHRRGTSALATDLKRRLNGQGGHARRGGGSGRTSYLGQLAGRHGERRDRRCCRGGGAADGGQGQPPPVTRGADPGRRV